MPLQRLLPTRMVVSFNEELKVFPKLVVAVVVVAFDSRFFEGAVHPLHLAIGPCVVGLGQSVFDVVLAADLIEVFSPGEKRYGSNLNLVGSFVQMLAMYS